MSQGAHVTFDSTDLKYFTFSTTPTFASQKDFKKIASCFWSEITSVESCAMVTSVDYPIHLGLAYLFLGGLDGFYGKVHVDGKLWPATCCGQVTFPAASSVPWTCREPSESLPLREKKIHLNVPFCIKGPYQGFSQQKASKRTPHWVRPKMWKIKNKNRRLL